MASSSPDRTDVVIHVVIFVGSPPDSLGSIAIISFSWRLITAHTAAPVFSVTMKRTPVCICRMRSVRRNRKLAHLT
ncbi:hypothetical protein V1264_008950 [Littorina saxatilis]|uniref:Uncharacterized protein n=1 Tax=Littorina saxatilis TaxID=31220 RepID=A0AAN9AQD1_9CAEN